MSKIRVLLFAIGMSIAIYGFWILFYASWEYMTFSPPNSTNNSVLGYIIAYPDQAIRYTGLVGLGVTAMLLSRFRA